jgi:crotonobetainyl-CoA:carnitine CoA-transferase CaiB-like acyl-CoA transferase
MSFATIRVSRPTNSASFMSSNSTEIIGDFIGGARTMDDNVAFFEAAEVTIGPVNDIVRLMNDRHVRRALLADYPDEDMGSFPMHAVPARLSETPGTIRTPAPRLDSTPAIFWPKPA